MNIPPRKEEGYYTYSFRYKIYRSRSSSHTLKKAEESPLPFLHLAIYLCLGLYNLCGAHYNVGADWTTNLS
jgi:hypothetical protein